MVEYVAMPNHGGPVAADVVALIRALITAAPVAGFDETTLRSGPAGKKKYVHGAFTEEYSAFWLGHPQPGLHAGRRDPPGFRRDRGLRPLPELVRHEAHCRIARAAGRDERSYLGI